MFAAILKVLTITTIMGFSLIEVNAGVYTRFESGSRNESVAALEEAEAHHEIEAAHEQLLAEIEAAHWELQAEIEATQEDYLHTQAEAITRNVTVTAQNETEVRNEREAHDVTTEAQDVTESQNCLEVPCAENLSCDPTTEKCRLIELEWLSE